MTAKYEHHLFWLFRCSDVGSKLLAAKSILLLTQRLRYKIGCILVRLIVGVIFIFQLTSKQHLLVLKYLWNQNHT